MSVKVIDQKTYQSLLNQGYVETSSQIVTHQGSKGRYVKLEKTIPMCERVTRVMGCLFAPFFCPISQSLTCCQAECCSCSELCLGGAASLDGFFSESGYIKDKELTHELRNKDFQALGYDCFSTQNIAALVESNKYTPIQSTRFPQHYFISFYGPQTNFSYIIVIPNGDIKGTPLFYCVSNAEGEPCNTAEIMKKAETLCGGYKPGAATIKTVTEKTLLANTEQNTPYGIYGGKTYIYEDRIVTK